MNAGQAALAFASWKSEDSVAVTGQTGILTSSRVGVSLILDTDDGIAQDWHAPYITSIVSGTGFTVNLRPRVGVFKGAVKVHWMWS